MMHILQSHVCGCVSAHPELPNQKMIWETSDASNIQQNQASWNGTVLKFGSEIQSHVPNYLQMPHCFGCLGLSPSSTLLLATGEWLCRISCHCCSLAHCLQLPQALNTYLNLFLLSSYCQIEVHFRFVIIHPVSRHAAYVGQPYVFVLHPCSRDIMFL